jgi:asparagine synthase (glutamine-hydrolysing)
MCGIAGAVVPGRPNSSRLRVRRMLDGLAHRGPDGDGIAQVGAVAIGMRRLRIRSSPDLVVPFALSTGARVAYNGEAYNARGEIPSGGPGEVTALLGSDGHAVDGMYALAILDDAGQLRLVRDPFGIKPLFLRTEGAETSFASELPPLVETGSPVEIDITALHELLAFGRTLDGRTLYKGIRDVTPGADLLVAQDGSIRVNESRRAELLNSARGPIVLRRALREAVAHTLASDRPIGLALSGGLDSSILAFELRALGVSNLSTVSISLPDNCDGLAHLSELTLGRSAIPPWRHSVWRIDEIGYFADLAHAARHIGEPFRMSSVPLYFALGEAAKAEGIRVLLLGEGADEIFGGYESYRRFSPSSTARREAISTFYLNATSTGYVSALIGAGPAADLSGRLEALIGSLIDGRSPKQALLRTERLLSLEPLLRRADHALMAVGVEGRTPFLHGGLPTLAGLLPDTDLWSHNSTKIALRRAYQNVLPHDLIAGPKRAFRAPVHLWRRGGVSSLEAIATAGRDLLNTLGVPVEGVAAIRNGCAIGDPAAIPLAVALLSTFACLSRFAEHNRLADPALARAGRRAAAIFAGTPFQRANRSLGGALRRRPN